MHYNYMYLYNLHNVSLSEMFLWNFQKPRAAFLAFYFVVHL